MDLRSGFTLMEIMMVMVIIAILAGSVMLTVNRSGDSSAMQRALTDFTAIETQLMSYRTLAGTYPTTAQGLDALVKKPTIPPKPRHYSPSGYMKKLPEDPWGNPYIYKDRGSKDSTTYEIICVGKDGEEGTADDFSSQDE